MKEWMNYRKKYICVEILGVIIVCVILLIGIISDSNVLKGNVLYWVDDLSSFSLTLLQIQASIATLTIALVALISGNISDSHMGISVSDYYLNIRPAILKQKIIIFLSIVFLAVGVFCHLGRAYNMTISLFIATVIIILISVFEIYSAFSGKKILEKEIESYISHIMHNSKRYQKKISICDSFQSDWIQIIHSQDITACDKYIDIFIKNILILLKSGTNECVKDVEKLSCGILETFLKSDKLEIKKRGIQYLDLLYEKIWLFIVDEKETTKDLSDHFSVFGNLQIELQDAISEIPAEVVEKVLDWKQMSDNIARVSFWICDDSRQKNVAELECINYFSRYLGLYLYKQRKKGNIINQNFWGTILETLYLTSAYNVPEGMEETFLHYKVEMYFNFCYGMIIYGFGSIVKESLFQKGMRFVHTMNNRHEALLYISLQCYLFYLAERESTDCVTLEVKNEANRILQDEEVKSHFKYIIQLLTYKEEFFDIQFENNIYNLLRRYEFSSRYSNIKTIIMQDVVREFYVFLLSYISNISYVPELLQKAIDESKIEEYYLNFLGEKENTIKEIFSKLVVLFDTRYRTKEDNCAQVGMMYQHLEKVIKQKYKEKSVRLAKVAQEEYERNQIKSQLILDIRDRVEEHLKAKFASILTPDINSGMIKLHLLSCNCFTKNIRADHINEWYWDMDGAFVNGLIHILQKRNILEIIYRNDFEDDIKYIDYLREKNVNVLLGAESVIRNHNYRNKEYFKSFSEECECIYTGFVSNGLALKRDSAKVCIHDINVSVHSLTFGETKINYDEDKQRYIYEISHGMPVEFEKAELESFIRDQKKIIDISAKISIALNDKNVGVVINDVR